MVFLGGRGTLWGPLIGVVVVHLLNQWIGVELGGVTQIVSGLIVVVICSPTGCAAAGIDILDPEQQSLGVNEIV